MLDKKLAELRKEKGLSQEELADVLATSRQAISKWERGEAYPDIEKIKDLARYFDVSIDYLLGFDLESLPVNEFSKSLIDKQYKNEFDVGIDEIKGMISKNPNNLNLYLASATYLLMNNDNKQDKEILDLVISYLNKSLVLYKKDNILNASINEIHEYVILDLVMQDKYDVIRKYIKDNRVKDVDEVMVIADFELGDYDDSMKKASDLYLSSLISIFNMNIYRILTLFKKGMVEDAYGLSKWSIDLLKSVSKEGNVLKDIMFAYMFFNAICEHYLGQDNGTIEYLKTNYDETIKTEDTNRIKYFYNENTKLFNIFGDIKKKISMYAKTFVGDEIYKDIIYVYDSVFGGND